jgi:hypothetical protein
MQGAMATSNFWRDLAVEFLAVPDSFGKLTANLRFADDNSVERFWWLDGASNYIGAAFETLARRGASEIAKEGTPDLLVFWLEALKQDGSSFQVMGHGSDPPDDGSERLHYEVGRISRLCETSANFCKKLEAQALQEEFEEKQLTKNQSPVMRSVSTSQDEEIERRRKLLSEYKTATKNSPNKRIYEAKNSGVHKPEFYQWVNGTLPADSATTITFERFLREKKPPIPRKPKG